MVLPQGLLWLVPACGKDDDGGAACLAGTDPMPEAGLVEPPGIWTPSWDRQGDAEVRDVQPRSGGGFTFKVYFVADATDVALRVRIPGDPPLPFDDGDLLSAWVSYHGEWSPSLIVSLATRDGTPLLSFHDGAFSPDVRPPRCFQGECGWMGLVPVALRPPGREDDLTAPVTTLHEGESVVLEGPLGTYGTFVQAARGYSLDPEEPLLCTDLPRGWSASVTLRLPPGWTDRGL